MDTIVKAASAEQLAAFQAGKVEKPKAEQVFPDGFEAEKTIPLVVPVHFNDQVYREVSVRRLKGRDFLALQRLKGDENLGLLSLVCSVPADVLEELDAEDFITVSEAAQDFLPQSFRTAAEPTSDSGQDSPR